MTDIVERLQEELKKRTSETSDWGEKQYVSGWNDALANAEIIIDLRAENERLREALKPFARIAEDYEEWESEKLTLIVYLRHLRDAKAALENK